MYSPNGAPDFPEIDFGTLRGCGNIKDVLSRTRFHAYLVYGNESSQRNAVAELLAGVFLCNNKQKVPCGVCPSCKKRLTGNHPDLIRIDSSVKAEDMRDRLEVLSYAPHEGSGRVFIFENADILRLQVQNILLKSIEEPPAGTVFIFIADTPQSLLQTVRSRCVTLSADGGEETKGENYDACRRFTDAVYTGDIAALIKEANAIEKIKDGRREKYRSFLLTVAGLLNGDIKAAVKTGDTQRLKRATAAAETVNGVIAETHDTNTNISLWLSYIIIKLSL